MLLLLLIFNMRRSTRRKFKLQIKGLEIKSIFSLWNHHNNILILPFFHVLKYSLSDARKQPHLIKVLKGEDMSLPTLSTEIKRTSTAQSCSSVTVGELWEFGAETTCEHGREMIPTSSSLCQLFQLPVVYLFLRWYTPSDNPRNDTVMGTSPSN